MGCGMLSVVVVVIISCGVLVVVITLVLRTVRMDTILLRHAIEFTNIILFPTFKLKK